MFVDESFYLLFLSCVENILWIFDLCRTPETDSTNPKGSIEPKLRSTALKVKISVYGFTYHL